MEDGEVVRLQDLLKVKICDSDEAHIGHIQDLAIAGDLSSAHIDFIGAHIHWTDCIGDIELVRPVEDIVFLIPWSQVKSFGRGGFHLMGAQPDFTVETAEGKLLLRADLLNKQLVDSVGNRIQRVDDVFITRIGERLKVIGLEVSKKLLLSSSAQSEFIEELKKRYDCKWDLDAIPFAAIKRVDDEAVVIGAEALLES